MLIYVEYITERLLYTLSFVLADRKIAYELTNDGIAFMAASGPKINYSSREFDACIQIYPATLLFSDEIYIDPIQKGTFNHTECLSFDGKSDLLASVFYVLTRMEEYDSLHTDALGRFEARASVLSKYGWLQKAICDEWSVAWIAYVEQVCAITLQTKKPRFIFQPTFDIDNTFAYAHKNNIRSFLAELKDFIFQRKERIRDRRKVRSGQQPDPYDSFDQISEIAAHFPETKVFWLLGNYTKRDKNLSHLNLAQQDKIKQIAAHAEIGIHGSSLTVHQLQQYQIEIERLNQITAYHPLSNRQHFLLMRLPNTYQMLLQVGIRHDYTMGYAEQTGFRAGTARPFKWFNLVKNEVTDLVVHPFVYMDGTLKEYLNLSPKEAIQCIEQLYREVKKCGGAFCFIWHNETIGGYQHWGDYKNVFKANFEFNRQ